MITITDYKPEYQERIDRMMQAIEKEFTVPITSPQSTKIHAVYHLPDQKFWVALHGDKIVGTAGLSLFPNGAVVLKRMMVDKNYRGTNANGISTAQLLLNTCMNWAISKDFKRIYLGTMDQFIAAQKFYAKNGFHSIEKKALPTEYTPNPIDTLYYAKDL